jgi:hypothetical protein
MMQAVEQRSQLVESTFCGISWRRRHRLKEKRRKFRQSVRSRAPGIFVRRPVPNDHAHAATERDARDFHRDSGKANQTECFTGELHAVLTRPFTSAHRAVNLREDARGAHIKAIVDSATAVSP